MARGVSRRAVITIYDFICEYTLEHQYTPTIKEICEGTLYESIKTVSLALKVLIEEGKLETDKDFRSPRAYRVAKFKIVRRD